MSKAYRLCTWLVVFLLVACGEATPTALPPVITETPTVTQPSDRTTRTGFYWPTSPPRRAYYAGFMADSCTKLTGKLNYFPSQYHVGTDIQANLDDAVKAISAGIIQHYSHSADWGTDERDGQVNDGLIIKHYLDDESVFYAVYGHIRTGLKAGNPVTAGQDIGKIRMWRYQDGKGNWHRGKDHLHFGIQPGNDFLNPSSWGIMECPVSLLPDGTLDKKGYVDPIDFIDNQTPGPVPAGLGAILTPTFTPIPGTTAVLIDDTTLGYFNNGLGTLLDGTQPSFPLANSYGDDEPTITGAPEPVLTSVASILGDWLSPDPLPLHANWSGLQPIPMSWQANIDDAIIYPVDAGPQGYARLVGNFGVDNGVFVWVNGEYKFGATAAGAVSGFEYTDIDLGSLQPGLNFIQILREDHSDFGGFTINIIGFR